MRHFGVTLGGDDLAALLTLLETRRRRMGQPGPHRRRRDAARADEGEDRGSQWKCDRAEDLRWIPPFRVHVAVAVRRTGSALDVGELLGDQPVAECEQVDAADVAVSPSVRPALRRPVALDVAPGRAIGHHRGTSQVLARATNASNGLEVLADRRLRFALPGPIVGVRQTLSACEDLLGRGHAQIDRQFGCRSGRGTACSAVRGAASALVACGRGVGPARRRRGFPAGRPLVRGTGSQPLTSRIRCHVDRRRVQVAAGAPARGRPQRQRRRVHPGSPGREERRVPRLVRGCPSVQAVSRAGRIRLHRDRARRSAGGLRRSRPDRSGRLARPGRQLPGHAAGCAAVLLPRRARSDASRLARDTVRLRLLRRRSESRLP